VVLPFYEADLHDHKVYVLVLDARNHHDPCDGEVEVLRDALVADHDSYAVEVVYC